MSDNLADTPRLGRRYCPTCEPTADPSREILEADYCGDHLPDRRGLDDSSVSGTEASYSYTVLDGGVDGPAWGELIHRGPRA